ncbi:hypothetical protein SANTM175S_03354 [Streptomyces antimycoticus]
MAQGPTDAFGQAVREHLRHAGHAPRPGDHREGRTRPGRDRRIPDPGRASVPGLRRPGSTHERGPARPHRPRPRGLRLHRHARRHRAKDRHVGLRRRRRQPVARGASARRGEPVPPGLGEGPRGQRAARGGRKRRLFPEHRGDDRPSPRSARGLADPGRGRRACRQPVHGHRLRHRRARLQLSHPGTARLVRPPIRHCSTTWRTATTSSRQPPDRLAPGRTGRQRNQTSTGTRISRSSGRTTYSKTIGSPPICRL